MRSYTPAGMFLSGLGLPGSVERGSPAVPMEQTSESHAVLKMSLYRGLGRNNYSILIWIIFSDHFPVGDISWDLSRRV